MSDAECRAAVRAGHLHRVRRGVYGTDDREYDFGDHAYAACLKARGLVCISGLAAAHLWGLWSAEVAIELTVRYPRNLKMSGVHVHRSRDLRRTDVTRLDSIPVTTPGRTMIDLGRVLPESEVIRVLEHALATGLVPRARVWQHRIDLGRQGRNGTGVAERILAAIAEDAEAAESGPEAAVMRLIARTDLPRPIPQWWTSVGGRRYRIDLAYPDARLAIEYDGREFHGPDRARSDAERERALRAAGWTVLRVRHADIAEERVGILLSSIRRCLAKVA